MNMHASIVRNMRSRTCKVVVAAVMLVGTMRPSLASEGAAVPPRRQPTPGPPATADRPEAATERGGREEACTVTDGAVLELLSMYHEREWSLSTDHFVLTMGATEAEGGDESGREGEGVRQLQRVAPPPRSFAALPLSLLPNAQCVHIGRHAPALLAPPPCAAGTR